MARKFDMPELAGHCDAFIAELDLTLHSLPYVLARYRSKVSFTTSH